MLINSWLTCPLSSLVLLHILSRAWSKDPPGVAFFFPVACKDSKSLTLTRLLLNTDYCNPLVSKIDGMVKKVNSFFFSHTVNLLHCTSLVMSIMYSYLNWLNLEPNISYCLELLAPLKKMYLEIPYVTIASTVLPPLPPVTWNWSAIQMYFIYTLYHPLSFLTTTFSRMMQVTFKCINN